MMMTFCEELITPDIAKTYLEHNRVNRRLNIARAKQYATDMKSGKWQFNGEAIKFYENGDLADGAHRLTGIVLSGIPVKLLVIRGLADDVSVQDRGRIRSMVDVLTINGTPRELVNGRTVAMAKLHFFIQLGMTSVSDGTVEDFLLKNGELLTEVTRVQHGRKRGINTESAIIRLPCFYAIKSGLYKKGRVFDFLRVLKSGIVDDPSENAAVVCRNDFLENPMLLNGGAQDRIHAVHIVEKAIDDFCSYYPRKKTYIKHNEPVFSNHPNNLEVAR